MIWAFLVFNPCLCEEVVGLVQCTFALNLDSMVVGSITIRRVQQYDVMHCCMDWVQKDWGYSRDYRHWSKLLFLLKHKQPQSFTIDKDY